jgi:cytidyltransferase-like protein
MIVDLRDAVSIDGLIANCEHIGREHRGIIGFYSGCWDCLHVGHVLVLTQARRLCDFLVVGVGTDRLVKADKGPDRPLYPELHRLNIVNSLKPVDACFLMDSEQEYGIMADKIVHEGYHGVMFKGSDWNIDKVPGYDPHCDYLLPVYKSRGLNVENMLRGNVMMIPRPSLQGSSTSAFLKRLQNEKGE